MLHDKASNLWVIQNPLKQGTGQSSHNTFAHALDGHMDHFANRHCALYRPSYFTGLPDNARPPLSQAIDDASLYMDGMVG